ncbi:Glutathione S-transferase hmp2 [Psilocybe cubensis]|uniref:Glutathione S-transferase hmp2 n=1 Tax=Psilocybe cubensis TaxID=181762 RepID=A0ACB8GPI6_PSICU|nr:Glutathione S-transferase hmp2 [Psilocybe cubensis]KAH9477390.1 Glutathione S-transferase hmp2 [Psilocybe cubensis]
MVLKVHGAPTPCTQRVLSILYEKQVPFELVPVDLSTAEHKGAKHLENHPFGLCPFIDDDGFVLYESRAIAQYIAMKYDNQGTQGLIPKDLKSYARFQQAASTETSYFNDLAGTILMERIFKPDEKLVESSLTRLAANLDVYEKILSKQKYLGGEEITLADLYHLPCGTLLPAAGTDVIEARPNVARWFKDLSSRESWKAALATTSAM